MRHANGARFEIAYATERRRDEPFELYARRLIARDLILARERSIGVPLRSRGRHMPPSINFRL